MLATLFGFQGRLGRLPYVGWSVAAMFLLIAVAAFFLMVGIGLAGATSPYGAGPKILGGLMALTSLVVGRGRRSLCPPSVSATPAFRRSPQPCCRLWPSRPSLAP